LRLRTIAAPSIEVAAEKSPEENNSSAPATAPSSDANAKALTLVIRATENSWISITADGQPVVHETLIAPAHTTVRAAREISVHTGNAGGITFLLNGKEIPAQGAEAEVKTLVFNATGLISP
jgi:cytoskeletal protein RodZ